MTASWETTVTEPSWNRTDSGFPPDGVEVLTMDSGGHVQRLVYERNLWFLPDRSMYVYFVPLMWRLP